MPFINDSIQKPGGGSLYCAQEHAVRFLTAAGVDVVTLSDERVSDFGTDGFRNTQRILNEAHILHFGTGETRSGDAFDELLIWQIKGLRIGAVAYANPGERTVSAILDRVRLLRQHDCALVIVSLNWADVTSTSPTAQMLTLAKQLIDGGADVIWGVGSDSLQPVYFHHGKPILSSMGALCDGYSGAVATFGAVITLEYDLTGETPALTFMRATPLKTGERGEYAPTLLEQERNRVYALKQLVASREREGLSILPADFTRTGEVWFDGDGNPETAE